MPRQPLSRVTSSDQVNPSFGISAINQRPALAAIVGDCLAGWSYVEAEMAVLLGSLLGAENAATLAVFQLLRRSSAQRDALSEAGKIALDVTAQELLSAIFDVHKSIEADRNALAHGHIGFSDKVPNGLLWMSTGDFITFRVEISMTRGTAFDARRYAEFLSKVSVYRDTDLQQILADVTDLWRIWFDFMRYSRLPRLATEERERQYRQLCGRPRIAQALVTLRQKNTPSTPPPPPRPTESEKS